MDQTESNLWRFALLRHDHPVLHHDLLLERHSLCWTWRLPAELVLDAAMIIERIDDHRKHYLTWEGEVPGDRGTVLQVDAGRYQLLERSDTSMRFLFDGGLLSGTGTVQRTPSANIEEFRLHGHPQNHTD